MVAWQGSRSGPPGQVTARIWLVAEVDGRVVGTVDAHLERPADDASRQILRDLAQLRCSPSASTERRAIRDWYGDWGERARTGRNRRPD